MKQFLFRQLPHLAALLIRVIRATMRIRYVMPESTSQLVGDRRPFVLTFWHGHLLMMVYAKYRKPIMTMGSQHRDGELVVRTIKHFGASAARGSTTRGGTSALRTMLLAAREGYTLAITPDGPNGPRRVAQKGVVQIAQATGLPVIPVAFVASRKTLLRSWDRFQVPHPFSRGIFVYGDPIEVPRKVSDEETERLRGQIERVLNELSDESEEHFEELWVRGIS